MAKRNQIDVDALLEDWMGVTKEDNPDAFKAWAAFRKNSLHCVAEPGSAFTVPTPFPPTTQQAADQYAAAVVQIRKSIGWSDKRAKPWDTVTPWR